MVPVATTYNVCHSMENFPYPLDCNGAGKTFLHQIINLVADLYVMYDIFPMTSTTTDGSFDWCGYDFCTKMETVYMLHGKCGEQ